MRRWGVLGLVCVAWAVPAQHLVAQTPASPPASGTLTARSTLVVVPALVRDKAGELVFGLKAKDFTLTDDGVPQKLRLEEDTGGEPLALVIVIEGGGAGVRELDKYRALVPMIESVVGDVPHRVAVVGFDSSPVLVQDFTADIGAAERGVQALIADDSGDQGAAILDSVGFSVNLLRKQPPEYRRAILLVSETIDHGSKLKLEDAVRAISDTNTAIYSVGFSTGGSGARKIWSTNSSDPPPPAGCSGCIDLMPEIRLIRMALVMAIDGLRRNTPETVAKMTGGEYFELTNVMSMGRDLSTIGNHIPNRYILSFQPKSPHEGFHVLSLQLKDYSNLRVTARNSYWADSGVAEGQSSASH